MHFRFSDDDSNNFLPNLSQQAGATLQSDLFESILTLPPRVGEGLMCRVELRPGLELRVQNSTFSEPLTFEIQSGDRPSSVAIHFCLAGYIQRTLQGQAQFNLNAGQSSLSFAENIVGTGEWKPQQRIAYVEIALETSTLSQIISHQLEFLPTALKSLIEGTDRGTYFHSSSLSDSMRQVTQHILNCPYQGLTRRLYLESKVIELIALRLDPLFCDRSQDKTIKLRSDDIDRIHYAKDILLSDLENPPSLLGLALQVGLNDYKLKRGFQRVFGTTVFGYLHDYRMQQAHQLLKAGNLNITEVSQQVGYNSLSSFNRAFKKKFGINPRQAKLL
jgi:AraC family transcriptional regulator, transcriptional activator of the genes for pyochelin and ferripyochelin receptors